MENPSQFLRFKADTSFTMLFLCLKICLIGLERGYHRVAAHWKTAGLKKSLSSHLQEKKICLFGNISGY